MSASRFSHLQDEGWWHQLGLRRAEPPLTSRYEHRVSAAVWAVLNAHPPVAFAGSDGGAPLSVAELTALIAGATEEAKRVGEEEHARTAEARRAQDQVRFESAYVVSDADEAITSGRWAGFSKGEAFAWSWTLFQYEPRGITHPGSQLRLESLQKLERGELPSVFDYPERARELAGLGLGLTPRQYRLHKEALGAKTFDPAQVAARPDLSRRSESRAPSLHDVAPEASTLAFSRGASRNP